MLYALNSERAARIRNEEREEIASHLHDSVLQTLALIQRQSQNPQEVARLARSQERELRQWLFSEPEKPQQSLAAALRTIAGEVEDQYGVRVTPVTVGDVPLDRDTESALPRKVSTAFSARAREALVNAAKHSGADVIDLYAETEPKRVGVFVRDRGVGFDVDDVPADRQGLTRSIRARVERRGGDVEVVSTPGKGTEVRIHVPRKAETEAVDDGDDGDDEQVETASTSRWFGERDGRRRRVDREHRRKALPGLPRRRSRGVPVGGAGGTGERIRHRGGVGEAGAVAEAVAGIDATHPNVVLLDVHMPDGGGVSVLNRINPGPVCLALSVSDAAEDVIAVIRSGARGYVTKTISGAELAQGIRRVAGGDAVFSPRLAGFVLDSFTGRSAAPGPRSIPNSTR